MATRHTIVPKGKTLDKMKCGVCHKPVVMTRDADRKRTWSHMSKSKAKLSKTADA